jgi:hypothetical protein
MPGFSRIKPLKENNKARVCQTQKKVPPCGGTFLIQLNWGSELAAALALLIGGLTVRILLLLSGLLPTALLLTGLLARILVLLAGILVLIGHRDLPC